MPAPVGAPSDVTDDGVSEADEYDDPFDDGDLSDCEPQECLPPGNAVVLATAVSDDGLKFGSLEAAFEPVSVPHLLQSDSVDDGAVIVSMMSFEEDTCLCDRMAIAEIEPDGTGISNLTQLNIRGLPELRPGANGPMMPADPALLVVDGDLPLLVFTVRPAAVETACLAVAIGERGTAMDESFDMVPDLLWCTDEDGPAAGEDYMDPAAFWEPSGNGRGGTLVILQTSMNSLLTQDVVNYFAMVDVPDVESPNGWTIAETGTADAGQMRMQGTVIDGDTPDCRWAFYGWWEGDVYRACSDDGRVWDRDEAPAMEHGADATVVELDDHFLLGVMKQAGDL